jgi:predicted NBD/HSP70 family sugar kinase
LERILKFLLWQRGGYKVMIAGCDGLTKKLSEIYSPSGARAFDYEFFGEKVYGHPLEVVTCAMDEIPEQNETSLPLGRHLDGCRIGFDLGGSDRKCAAVIDGEVVFSEEVEWNPYFEKDPSYHIEGINDTLKRAAAHLPRVDAIGGSSAGVYVNSEVRVASLFRGVSPEDFESKVRRIFFDLQKRWDNVPFDVVNDGEVTALAGSMSMNENAVLGLAMGTSEAVGYVTPEGNITPWLNELAFAPVDYRADAPADEWSGDIGCGAQYFSQQAVARLVPASGIDLPADMPFPEQLIEVQKLMADGDERAAKIYATIGTYLGYAIAHYADFYDMKKMLLLGRVTSGEGGTIIIEKAKEVLRAEFPALAESIEIVTPNEKDKRHGQAVAAASLPMIQKGA